MDRKKFIRTCSIACAGGGVLSLIVSGCSGSKMVTGRIDGNYLSIPVTEFLQIKKDSTTYRKYIIAQNPQLQYPVCVYRFSENEFTALLMKCTHQGNELSAYGDKLHCAAHGSEFNRKGEVTMGPADKPLRNFPVTIENNFLKISLITT